MFTNVKNSSVKQKNIIYLVLYLGPGDSLVSGLVLGLSSSLSLSFLLS